MYVPISCDDDHRDHFTPRSLFANQYERFLAIGGKPIDWNQPLTPQKKAKIHKSIEIGGKPKKLISFGIKCAHTTNKILTNAEIKSAEGKILFALVLSAIIPFINFPAA